MAVNEAHFRKLLREKGLKVTNQRLRILEVLESSPNRHLTAEEIYRQVKDTCPDMGLATVYRTIQLFLELQLIDRIDLNDGLVRYEIGEAGQTKHRHHHLICRACGKVQAFEDDLLEELETKLFSELSFQVVDHEVKLFGYCRECREMQAEQKLSMEQE